MWALYVGNQIRTSRPDFLETPRVLLFPTLLSDSHADGA